MKDSPVVKAIACKEDTQAMSSPSCLSLWFGTAFVQPRISVHCVVNQVLSVSANFRVSLEATIR